LQLLREQRIGEEAHAGNIAAGPIHAGNEAEFHGMRRNGSHDVVWADPLHRSALRAATGNGAFAK
jgi:hypothetical protein